MRLEEVVDAIIDSLADRIAEKIRADLPTQEEAEPVKQAKKKTAAKKKAEQTEKKAEQTEKKAEPETGDPYAEARKLLAELAKKDRPRAVELLAEYGAESLTKVPLVKIDEFMEENRKILEEL